MTQTHLREALDSLADRVGTTLDQTGEAFPYHADPETGEWTTTADGNWCGGYWVHMLWLAHDLTGESRFATAAREHAAVLADRMPPHTMFCGLAFHYGGFRAYDRTGEDRDRDLGLRGADAMVDYYHEGARQIPVGEYELDVPDGVETDFRNPGDDVPGDRRGVVDAVHAALSVLWRAYRETGDPTYRDVAVSHADRHLDWYVRPDGRTWHVAQFDPASGTLERRFNDLAYGDETCWARGQGWCIAGLATAYAETGGGRYLDALEGVTDYYVDHTPADLVPHWDFEHPAKPDVPRDTSAAALAAYGLSGLPAGPETRELRRLGESITESLVENYLTPVDAADDRPPGMVLSGCYDGPAGYADDNELVWTDHYLMATLYRRLHG